MMANVVSTNSSEFTTDQAAILRDLALHGYSDARSDRSNDQSNGEEQPTSFEDMEETEDMEDSAALLGSLAGFAHVPGNSDDHAASVSNDHFASLLEAAATAGGEEAARQGHAQRPQSPLLSRGNGAIAFFNSGSKRKRNGEDEATPRNEKRSKRLGFIKPTRKQQQQEERLAAEEQQDAFEREIWGPELPDGESNDDWDAEKSQWVRPRNAAKNARALGVQSAAALFRKPSAASRKYARAPMAKLFASLEMSPEEFLHLQSAAKAYMLDKNHPERSDCIGGRSKGDSDMVKLKLIKTVESFLIDEGWGERCWGKYAMGAESRELQWPEAKQKIIPLIIPLLRRMVTNERQRQYAIEQRNRKLLEKGIDVGSKQTTPTASAENTPQVNGTPFHSLQPQSPDGDVDPKLNQYHYNPDPQFAPPDPRSQFLQNEPLNTADVRVQSTEEAQVVIPVRVPVTVPVTVPVAVPVAVPTTITYVVNIVQGKVRIKPRFSVTPKECPEFLNLLGRIQEELNDDGKKLSIMKVLGPNGQVDVCGDDTMNEVVNSIKEHEWMDGTVTCIALYRATELAKFAQEVGGSLPQSPSLQNILQVDRPLATIC
ncbi:hypothetical protein G7Y89_g11166 [Cudoniella acicularis]|uniref:Uncharacterized protein n=1 Tax=Cudoniella acicularis TaxID=354080 RepID=A0A8H4RDQ7_9HELO|nr:hypothetical protein G7Y89_g11166 [Cudoniella acicularis]